MFTSWSARIKRWKRGCTKRIAPLSVRGTPKYGAKWPTIGGAGLRGLRNCRNPCAPLPCANTASSTSQHTASRTKLGMMLGGNHVAWRRARFALTMSLQVSLASPAIRTAYEKVLDGAQDYVVLSYKKLSNDLDVAASAKGTLDDLVEEFSDGKIQYAFTRVTDPNTQLPKFVLINWCGEGVPENRKGLFASHSASVADYFKAYHVSINARAEEDLVPQAIMRKVTDSSGSKYGAASSVSGGKIEPVGTNYKPVGTPDIRGMQAKAPKDTIQPTGTTYTPAREEIKQLREGTLGKESAAARAAPGSAAGQGAAAQGHAGAAAQGRRRAAARTGCTRVGPSAGQGAVQADGRRQNPAGRHGVHARLDRAPGQAVGRPYQALFAGAGEGDAAAEPRRTRRVGRPLLEPAPGGGQEGARG